MIRRRERRRLARMVLRGLLVALALCAVSLLSMVAMLGSDKERLAPTTALPFHLAPEQARPFLLVWTTAPETFSELNWACLESLYLMHPTANVTVLSNTLTVDFFTPISSRFQISISVVPMTDALLHSLAVDSGSTSAVAWVDQLEEWRSGEFFYSHITDFIRFTWLLAHGGTYCDFDVIWVNSMHGLVNAVGLDNSGSVDCEWCVDGELYTAPGVMISFTPKLPELVRLMDEFFDPAQYQPDLFNSVGPKPLTITIGRGRTSINVLDQVILYPWNYQLSPAMFKNDSALEHFKSKVEMQSLALHIFGHVSRSLNPEPGSVIAHFAGKFRLQCRGVSIQSERLLNIGRPHYSLNDAHVLLQGQRVLDCLAGGNVRYSLSVSTRSKCSALALISAGTAHSLSNPSQMIHRTNQSFFELSLLLSEIAYYRCPASSSSPLIDSDQVSYLVTTGHHRLEWQVKVYDIGSLLTFCVKTMGNTAAVEVLVSSIRKRYSNVRILVVDDGPESPEHAVYAQKENVHYYRVPFDTGLSACRNFALGRTQTPYAAFLDDDFSISSGSDYGHMIRVLEESHGRFSLVAFRNPVDEKVWGFDFNGFFKQVGKKIEIVHGQGECILGCCQVDIHPNIFVGKTKDLKAIGGWDEQLKLGEHEDFFLRLKERGYKTATCALTSVTHHQQRTGSMPFVAYRHNRNRAQIFMRQMLRKHGLESLWTFGKLTSSTEERFGESTDLCAFGFAGKDCKDCRTGFRGPFCNQCKDGFGGERCQRCFCLNQGVCAPISDSLKCICPDGFFGNSCELKAQLAGNALVNAAWSKRSPRGGDVIGWTTSPCCSVNGTVLECLTKARSCAWSQEKITVPQNVRSFQIEATSLWLPGRSTDGPNYACYCNVHHIDGSSTWNQRLDFYQHSGWQTRKIFFKLKRPIASIDLFVVSGGPAKWKNVRLVL